MGNPFPLLVRMQPAAEFSDADIRTRFQRSSGAAGERQLLAGQLPTLRAKWASLSESIKEINQGFSRWYKKRHGRKGFFWGAEKSGAKKRGSGLAIEHFYLLHPIQMLYCKT